MGLVKKIFDWVFFAPVRAVRDAHWWWVCLENYERSFYKINTVTQIVLLLTPGFAIEYFDTAIEAWYQANPPLFQELGFLAFCSAIIGWVFFMFFARWLISVCIIAYYRDADVG